MKMFMSCEECESLCAGELEGVIEDVAVVEEKWVKLEHVKCMKCGNELSMLVVNEMQKMTFTVMKVL